MPDRLLPEEQLDPGERLESPSKRYDVPMQHDGNLVIYDREPHAVWGAGTEGKPGTAFKMQGDGNLVAYQDGVPVWASGTFTPGSIAKISDEGDLRVVAPDRVIVWSSVPEKIGTLDPIEIEPPVIIIPGTPDETVRGVGCSEYALQCAPYDYQAFLGNIREEHCRHTRITLWNAWETGIPGTRAGYFPSEMRSDGKFDLFKWRPDYFDRLTKLVTYANRLGIFPVLSVLELYTWSERKQGTPDKRLQPFQNNVNGVYWSDRDSDEVWGEIAQPGDWVWHLAVEIGHATWEKGLKLGFEVSGNEMPEKALAARVYDAFYSAGFRGYFQTNRQEDKPSMYANMISGVEPGIPDTRPYHAIAWHGRSSMAYLDEHFEGEPSHRPSSYRSMWDHTYAGPWYDRTRMVFSSDGCRSYNDRVETYNWDELVPVAVDAIQKGAAYEHQSCTKMGPYLGLPWDPNVVHLYDSKLLRPCVEAWEAVQRN